MRMLVVFGVGVAMTLLAGCGEAPSGAVSKVVPVSGKIVNTEGKPVANAWVVFNPKDPPGNEATATTQSDGTFRLGTFAKEDGVIPGRYVVTVQPHPDPATGGRPNIPSRYRSTKDSPLTIEISSDGPKELVPIQLK